MGAFALIHSARPGAPFRVDAFNIAGVFDADWLLERRYTRLLDTMAASPGAFGTVRFFGALNAGEREDVFPTSSGRTWPDPAAPMDFSPSFAALDALVSRGITPFVGLTFFPRAVSPGPVTPPPDGYGAWRRLVRGFLDATVARYRAEAVSRWWFEGWNEPNMPPFWGGSFDQYLDLYRATSEAVLASGHAIRLGGPVLAPGLGAQGGSVADLRRLFGRDTAVVPTVSRDVLAAGPDPTGLRAAAERWATELAG